MSETENNPSLKVRVRDYLTEKGILDSVLDAVRSRIVASETGSFKEEELETLVYETLKRCLVWKELCIVQLSGEDYDALLQMVPNSQ
ncbi:hypothetical protein WA556_006397 [Blastocystis sp. ATCC 50177/Nand II]